MFKSVEYVGFEGNPELKSKAESLLPVLAEEVGARAREVGVRWSPHPDLRAGALDLTLSRTLDNGVSATHTGTLTAADFTRDTRLARRCGRVWYDLLGVLLDRQHERVQEALLEPAEA